MGLSQAAVIPIASLSAIVVVSIAFVIWWFPRTWSRGNAEEQRIYDLQIKERDEALARMRAEQAVNRPADEESGTAGPPPETAEAKPPAYVARPYVPPVTSY